MKANAEIMPNCDMVHRWTWIMQVLLTRLSCWNTLMVVAGNFRWCFLRENIGPIWTLPTYGPCYTQSQERPIYRTSAELNSLLCFTVMYLPGSVENGSEKRSFHRKRKTSRLGVCLWWYLLWCCWWRVGVGAGVGWWWYWCLIVCLSPFVHYWIQYFDRTAPSDSCTNHWSPPVIWEQSPPSCQSNCVWWRQRNKDQKVNQQTGV